MLSDFKIWWEGFCSRPFTDEQIETHKRKAAQAEYVRYCKLAASLKMFSDKQLSFKEFTKLKNLGFVESVTSKGQKVWYNRVTDTTVCPVKLWHYKTLILNNKDISTKNLYVY